MPYRSAGGSACRVSHPERASVLELCITHIFAWNNQAIFALYLNGLCIIREDAYASFFY